MQQDPAEEIARALARLTRLDFAAADDTTSGTTPVGLVVTGSEEAFRSFIGAVWGES